VGQFLFVIDTIDTSSAVKTAFGSDRLAGTLTGQIEAEGQYTGSLTLATVQAPIPV